MAKIRNFVLPSELNESLVLALEVVPDEVLTMLGRGCLPGGFTRASAIRERLAAAIRGQAALEPWLTGLLSRVVRSNITTHALSAEALRGLLPSLAALVCREKLLLALLLDEREEVHKLGVEWHAKTFPDDSEAVERQARQALIKFANEFLLPLTGAAVTPPPDLREAVPAKPDGSAEALPPDDKELCDLLERLQKELKALDAKATSQEKLIERLKRSLEEQRQRQREKLDSLARAAGQEKHQLALERDQARKQLRLALKEKEALTHRLETHQERQQKAVDEAVAEQTSALVRKWLVLPQETERHLEALSGKVPDLLTRAEQALEAQARQDRFSGNRLEMERRLAQLREARERLAQAAQTALCPITQVKEVLADVEAEIAHTERVLTGQRPADPLASRLLAAINQATEWLELRNYSELLQELAECELIPRNERRRLFDAIQRKYSWLEEANRPRGDVAPDNGWALRGALFRNRDSVVLLDGYNILFGLEDIFRPDFDDKGCPGRKARERLVSLVTRLVDGRSNVCARICFDAPHRHMVRVKPNLEIEFSGGGNGEHRADRRINDHLQVQTAVNGEKEFFVVTDDRAVRRHARKAGAIYVPVDLFAVLLADFRCLQ